MTARVRKDDLARIALVLRRGGELLVHPCGCGREGCTLGLHVYEATKNMTAGLRAAALDPDGRGWRYEHEPDPDGNLVVWPVPSGDSTGESATGLQSVDPHDAYMRNLVDAVNAASRVVNDVATHRPDRVVEAAKNEGREDFCRHHMDTIAVWEPRYRGDLCRGCDDFRRAYQDLLPPEPLLRARHEGKRWTETMVADAVREARARRKKRKKRKAS